MTNYVVINFLKCIQNQDSFDAFLDAGFTYLQLANAIIKSKENNYIFTKNNQYYLTEDGIKLIGPMKEHNHPEPLTEFKIEKIGLDDIYIPQTIREGKREIGD